MPYRALIDWLEAQEKEEALAYWGTYVAGYESQAGLPQSVTCGIKRLRTARNGADGERSDDGTAGRTGEALPGDAEYGDAELWGILLGRYIGTQDVVFGSVVSGRPADIAGVEDMIGLFINTIPVRVSWEAEQRLADVLERDAAPRSGNEGVRLRAAGGYSGAKRAEAGLFSHIMVFENYPVEESVKETGEEALGIGDVSIFEQTNYDFNVIVLPGKAMQVRFSYNARVYDTEMVERLRGICCR